MIVACFKPCKRSFARVNDWACANVLLLEQIQQLKRNQNPLVLELDDQVNLNLELLEQHVNQKLNKTDWKVLNELVKDPLISNKMIAEKIFMSVEGVSSSLRRMYIYFDIDETRYKKIALVMKAIQVSKSNWCSIFTCIREALWVGTLYHCRE